MTAHGTDMDPDLEVSSSHALVRSVPMELASPADVRAAIAQRDEAQILAMMAGEVITEFFYEFRVAGKLVEGVSVTGANEFARIRADNGFPIRFPPGSIHAEEVIQHDQRGIRVITVARDCRSGADGIGMCFQPYLVERKIKDKEGNVIGTEMVENNHADRKALSISKRNAILSILPEAQILVILRERKKLIAANEREQRTALAGAQQRQLPPAVATPARHDPYDNAAPAATSAPARSDNWATDEQLARLQELLRDQRIPDRVRTKVEKGIRERVNTKIAAAWITSIETQLNPQPAATSDDSEELDLGLGAGARKSVDAVAAGH